MRSSQYVPSLPFRPAPTQRGLQVSNISIFFSASKPNKWGGQIGRIFSPRSCQKSQATYIPSDQGWSRAFSFPLKNMTACFLKIKRFEKNNVGQKETWQCTCLFKKLCPSLTSINKRQRNQGECNVVCTLFYKQNKNKPSGHSWFFGTFVGFFVPFVFLVVVSLARMAMF